jgi:hypothetical protein
MRLIPILLASVTFVATQGRVTVAASCSPEPVRRSIERDTVAAVFSGTVVGAQFAAAGPILTFKVDTVWKGDVSRMVLVYHSTSQPLPPTSPRSTIARPPSNAGSEPGRGAGPALSGLRPFELGRRFVVIASRLTDDHRAAFKVEFEGERFGTDSCGGRPFDEVERMGDLERIGPGRAPR